MTTKKAATIKIGLLATGNELTEGDILNTNGQLIAKELSEAGFSMGLHVIASDAEEDIIGGLQFLLARHAIIIITGGLGPTSDDRTRFALSAVLNKPLIFDETSWNNIVARYQRLGLSLQPHPNNQQQALFPAGAHIIPNTHGTAAGCVITHGNKMIYMLPGPPNECLPMFKDYVLPGILTQQTTLIKKLKWRLLGVIESEIAAKVDALLKDYPVQTGYRFDRPYLDVKVYIEENKPSDEITTKVNQLLAPFLIGNDDKSASDLLKETLEQTLNIILIVDDKATHGYLQGQFIDPALRNKLIFDAALIHPENAIRLAITGLNEFWDEQADSKQTTIRLTFNAKQQEIIKEITLPLRKQFALKYAVEYISWEILKYLKKTPLIIAEPK